MERVGATDEVTAATAVARRAIRPRSAVRFALQLTTILVAVGFYRLVRGMTQGDHEIAVRNSLSVLDVERRLQFDVEQGLQALVMERPLLVTLANTVYVWGFWSLVALTLLVLFIVDRQRFRWYRNALFVSGAVGLTVFAAFPVAPPRMLDGFVDTIREFSDSSSIAHPGSFTNEYAAMPSFHVGWLVLAGVATMPVIRRRSLRPLLLVPAFVMTLTVMVTANHYLLDALAGATIALAGLIVARRLPALSQWWAAVDARLIQPHGGLGPVAVRVLSATGRGLLPFVGGRAMQSYLAVAGDGAQDASTVEAERARPRPPQAA
ncbi:phosphatase PAP2 family protein [Desertimonas flava]|uniref:phosphatase PAP2 family protein n=1 Tax=Desertimonas flava TaxID=2064846 RepID=UPI000E3415BC|nr:phosphatase PAP2 family protein [Desertimonas flava]